MRRQRIIGLAALAALVIAALATRGFGLLATADDASLKLYGNVDVRQVELAFRLPGRIEAIAFEEGAKVPAGAVIATLDGRTFANAARAAEAQVAEAEAELARTRGGNRAQEIGGARAQVAEQRALVEKARQDLQRRESLLPSGAVSRALVTASRGEYQAALARLRAAEQALSLQTAGSRPEDIRATEAKREAAQAEAARARIDVSDTRLIAPAGGAVLTRAREPGAIVQPGETVLTLSIDRPLRIRAYVAAQDLSRISPGMKVHVTATGNAKTYHGTIGFISPTAEFTPKTVQTEELRAQLVYRLRIIVSDPDDALRQGQPVSVTVPGARPKAKS